MAASAPKAAENEQMRVAAARLRLQEGIVKRIDGAGSLLASMQDRVKAGTVDEDELGALSTVIELCAGMQQMVLVHLQSGRVQVSSENEQRIVTG